jgi:hypothetical protein
MLAFEQLAIGYFAALGIAAPFAGAGKTRTSTAVLSATIAIGTILVLSRTAEEGVRIWVPHIYLVAGYWMPALLLARTPGRFEAWLKRSDAGWRRFRVPIPAYATHAVEVAYLFCYPMIPMALLAVRAVGSPADAERFWLSVLGAGFACYGSLPWLVTRPPRMFGGGGSIPIRHSPPERGSPQAGEPPAQYISKRTRGCFLRRRRSPCSRSGGQPASSCWWLRSDRIGIGDRSFPLCA